MKARLKFPCAQMVKEQKNIYDKTIKWIIFYSEASLLSFRLLKRNCMLVYAEGKSKFRYLGGRIKLTKVYLTAFFSD